MKRAELFAFIVAWLALGLCIWTSVDLTSSWCEGGEVQ